MPVDLSTEVILRWDAPAIDHIPLFTEGGITALWLAKRDERMERACAAAGIKIFGPDEIRLVKSDQLEGVTDLPSVVVKDGVWSGATLPKQETIVAGATRRPWVEANGFRVGYLRALYPGLRPVLGYQMDAESGVKPGHPPALSSLELALIDAWAAGGNYVLSLAAEHRQALIGGQAAARATWRSLGRTARWLRANVALFRQPVFPNITMLVEGGETTPELASLMYRQNVSPRLARVADLNAPDSIAGANECCRVLVTAGIQPPREELRARMVAYAVSGATVVTDAYGKDAWWRQSPCKLTRAFEDREFYTFGRGRVVAYKGEIQDPGDFALDVLDLAGQERALRLWDNGAVIALAMAGPAGGPAKAVLCAVNYGHPIDWGLLAQLHGHYTEATLLRPEAKPLKLRVARRGPSSEVVLPRLGLLAVVVFA